MRKRFHEVLAKTIKFRVSGKLAEGETDDDMDDVQAVAAAEVAEESAVRAAALGLRVRK